MVEVLTCKELKQHQVQWVMKNSTINTVHTGIRVAKAIAADKLNTEEKRNREFSFKYGLFL